MVEIRRWSLVDCDEKFVIDKNINLRLAGYVTDDQRFPENSYIITSQIISFEGRSLISNSGTHYYLVGAPEEAWVKFCEEDGWEINPDNVLDGKIIRTPKSQDIFGPQA